MQATLGNGTPPSIRVLVVEDNPLNQELVLGYLEGSEFEVTLAGDGRRGVEAFARERFDVVLRDWQMPEMDGLEAARRIREIEHGQGLRRTPIIAVTAHGRARSRRVLRRRHGRLHAQALFVRRADVRPASLDPARVNACDGTVPVTCCRRLRIAIHPRRRVAPRARCRGTCNEEVPCSPDSSCSY